MEHTAFDVAAEVAAARSSSGVALRRRSSFCGSNLLSLLLGTPLPWWQCGPVSPQAAFIGPCACFGLYPFAAETLGAILRIYPCPAIVNHGFVDVEAVGRDQSHGAAVAVSTSWLDAHLAACQQAAQALGCNCAKVLTALRRIDPMQPHLDLFAISADNADSVAIADANHAHRRGCPRGATQKQQQKDSQQIYLCFHPFSIRENAGNLLTNYLPEHTRFDSLTVPSLQINLPFEQWLIPPFLPSHGWRPLASAELKANSTLVRTINSATFFMIPPFFKKTVLVNL